MSSTSPPRHHFAALLAASRAWRRVLAVLVVAVSYLALSPDPPFYVDTGWDKLNHVLAFAALAFSASLGCPLPLRARLRWLGAVLAFGGLIEILQRFVPGRTAEWADLFADALGIALGALIAAAAQRSARWPSGRAARPE